MLKKVAPLAVFGFMALALQADHVSVDVKMPKDTTFKDVKETEDHRVEVDAKSTDTDVECTVKVFKKSDDSLESESIIKSDWGKEGSVDMTRGKDTRTVSMKATEADSSEAEVSIS